MIRAPTLGADAGRAGRARRRGWRCIVDPQTVTVEVVVEGHDLKDPDTFSKISLYVECPFDRPKDSGLLGPVPVQVKVSAPPRVQVRGVNNGPLPTVNVSGAAGGRNEMMAKLGVNIDHVATIRQARKTYEPDPVWAAAEAELGGADQITVHLREDRRHIQDRDVEILIRTVQTRVNLEMAVASDILGIALNLKPHCVCLVPERRQEVTTEGGLDVAGSFARVQETVKMLADAGIEVSLFIDPDPKQIEASAKTGAPFIELHTGSYADARGEARGRAAPGTAARRRAAGACRWDCA